MARSQEEIISEMVDSGLFSDDEIRSHVKEANAGATSAAAGGTSAMLEPEKARPRPDGAAGYVKRLAQDTLEGLMPPTSVGALKRLMSPQPGQYGPNRFAQDMSAYGKEDINKAAENFVQKPGVNQYPRIAAAMATAGTMPSEMAPSPRDLPGMAVLPKVVNAGIEAEMFLRDQASKLGKAAISVVSPASLDAVKARFENPASVKNALTREQLGNSVVASMNDLSGQIGKGDIAAKNTLSGEQTLPKDVLIEQLEALKKRYVGDAGVPVSQEAKGSVGQLNRAISGLKKINPLPDTPPIELPKPDKIEYNVYTGNKAIPQPPEVIPGETNKTSDMMAEKQLKDVMSQYKNINWDDPAGGAKKEIRKTFDRQLKSGNPEYKEAMKPVADRAKVRDVITRKMGLRYDPTTGTYATDTTSGKWTPALLEGKKPETSAALKKLGELTNNDLPTKARYTSYREQFTGGKTNGSRMVQLGRAVGGTPGAMLGASIDRLGGDMSGRLIDALVKIPEIPSMPKEVTQPIAALLGELLSKKRKEAADVK